MVYNSLRTIRDQKAITIAQLAGKTSISIRTLQSYEAGERAILPDDLRKLSRLLLVTPAEILRQPATPPPAPTPAPTPAAVPAATPAVAPVVLTFVPPAPAPPVADDPPMRRTPPPRPRPVSRGPDDPPPAPRPHLVRPPREVPPPRLPGPSSTGQQDQIRHLARRLGLEESQVVERLGTPLAALDHTAARDAIARLRREMEESGTWLPRVGEGPDQEAEYLGKLRDQSMPLDVRLIDGTELGGTIVDFTAYLIRLRRDDNGSEVSVRKLAIAYYQTRRAVDDAQ
jgi:sRNA-binding regulator protein Hfq